ncbi:ABC transporter ATP-binding protein [Roseibium sp. SCP14]|uniref:ABC transporter ATP-binding protein n=1 Tax=Roseibium sp. SCP14 TaxID=3141375 RepID=UPI0033354C49
MAKSLLEIRGLNVSFPLSHTTVHAVRNVDMTIGEGEVAAIVGESGSGKTMIGRSILDLLPQPGIISSGSIHFQGNDLTTAGEKAMRAIRGAKIGMIFQEPLVSLNPSLRIGVQMFEAMKLHSSRSMEEIRQSAMDMLERVKIPDPARCLERFPHEFSGGMRQRIMIASVMMLRPRLLIADEPTTALDAVVQKEVLDIMKEIANSYGTAVLLVSHNLGAVAHYADTITVMSKGKVVEHGKADQIIRSPNHVYTQKLLKSLPSGCPDQEQDDRERTPLLQVRNLAVDFQIPSRWPFGKPSIKRAVDTVSLDISEGEMIGVVGESGSGKTTLGRAIVRLLDTKSGEIHFRGTNVLAAKGKALRKLRTDMQVIFQDPFSSLNPRMKIGALVGEGLRHVPGLSKSDRDKRVHSMLKAVALDADYAERLPHELSGGQRQRIAIARALISKPKLVIADEPVSALDVTVQAQILELLRTLRDQMGFACLFISHDLGVVESICDRVLVMYHGHVLENADTVSLFERPQHPYTCQLLNAVPMLVKTNSGYEVQHTKRQATADMSGTFFTGDVGNKNPAYLQVGKTHWVAVQH